jgi:KEOPS complex subunit Cgi121
MILCGAYGKIKDVTVLFNEIDQLSKQNNVIIQIVNADVIFGKDHIVSAYYHTNRCFENNTNSLDDKSLEFLLYLSGERQISKAIKKVGITNQVNTFAIIIIPLQKENDCESILAHIVSQFNFVKDDAILAGDKTTLKRFGISEKEISTVPEENYADIILEKVALVDIIK